jgi:hypothetical protein
VLKTKLLDKLPSIKLEDELSKIPELELKSLLLKFESGKILEKFKLLLGFEIFLLEPDKLSLVEFKLLLEFENMQFDESLEFEKSFDEFELSSDVNNLLLLDDILSIEEVEMLLEDEDASLDEFKLLLGFNELKKSIILIFFYFFKNFF